ncbi:cation acetate symporter [Nocardioides sp.]|uniref:sodium/solute symporter n=1 Tax=Nocardioides sp. TaxID=35761 RepID=UPI002CF6D7D6|nr:cation acetate symporter [Nocardioides sp.]HVX54940.1 cation acetate symporter [Nocardioides sp.]
MSREAITALAALLVCVLTLAVGSFGLRISRTTSDFYVASRTVGPATNAAAISGEYLSAASFLGVAGLVMARGVDMLWYPVGWTAGYLVLLLFVAAPLRRSRAYTLPDFAEFRLESQPARTLASALGVLIAVLYLIPQFQGAGLTVHTLTGAPSWVGATAVALVVLLGVVAGGMRSITLVQAVQYWLKLAALLTPLAFLLLHHGGGAAGAAARLDATDWVEPMRGPHSLYLTYSLILATFLGTMGLPHVVVRFYTNRDGYAARRTTVAVLGLLSAFYLLPPVYGVLGRRYLSTISAGDPSDTAVLDLPGHVLHGTVADLLTAVLAAGAFAAFLSTSSGLVLSIAGVIGQDVLGRRFSGVAAFRISAAFGALATLALTVLSTGLAVAHSVELAFAVAASTFCPMLLLGIWWPGLTAAGAITGMSVGGTLSTAAVMVALFGHSYGGLGGAVLSQPALLTVPLAFATMVLVSVATTQPAHVARTMVRLHTPEAVAVDRGAFRPRNAD